MIDADIKKEFSKAMNYQEVFLTATRLKNAGENPVKVNKYLTMRRNELAKQINKIKRLSVTQIDTSMVDPESIMCVGRINYVQNGSIIEWDGNEVTLR